MASIASSQSLAVDAIDVTTNTAVALSPQAGIGKVFKTSQEMSSSQQEESKSQTTLDP